MRKARTSTILRITSGKLPPIVNSLLVFLVLIGVLSVIFKVENIKFTLNNYKFSSYFILAFTYLIYVSRIVHNRHVRSFNALLKSADLDETESASWLEKMANHRSQLPETLVAIVVGALHAWLQGYGRIFSGESRFLIYESWGAILTIMAWVSITHATSLFIRNLTLLNELSVKVKIDLLNMDKFMPLTISGVWSILGFIGVYSILFTRGVSNINLFDPAILVMIPSVFWMIRTPLKGFRKRVVTEKERELGLIDAAIEGDHEALKNSRIGANLSNINVIDLISYKRIIQNTLEIPVNIPTASRFLFYLIIPLLTWIAASMVDKVIDYLIK